MKSLLEALRRIYDVLSPSGKRRLAWLLLCNLVMAALEAANIASIGPLMALIVNPGVLEKNGRLHAFYQALGCTSPHQFTIAVGWLFLALLVLRNLFATFSNWFTLKFVYDQTLEQSRLLLMRYLSRPYAWFLQRNTAILGKSILSDVEMIMLGVFLPTTICFSRGVAATIVAFGLACIHPGVAISAGLSLSLLYALAYRSSRSRAVAMGAQFTSINSARHKLAMETLQGFKDIKVLGREQGVVEAYGAQSARAFRILTQHGIIVELPRFLLETMAFGSMIGVLLFFLIANKQALQNLIPIMAVYAVAGYRLMPALQQAFSALSTIRLNWPLLDDLHDELMGNCPDLTPTRTRLELQKELSLEKVTYTYHGATTPALTSLTMKIPKNTSVGLVGSTGAGKTTLADVFLGLLQPQVGHLQVDSVAVTTNQQIRAWRSNVGYVAQQIYLSDRSVLDNIAFGIASDRIDQGRVETAARIANIHDFIVTELPLGYATIVGDRGVRLSGGQRQRIGIARALYHNPDVIVMDEATSALDSLTEEAVMQAINNVARCKTLILVAHRLATIRNCSIIYEMERGEIKAQGTYDELLSRSDSFRKMASANRMAEASC